MKQRITALLAALTLLSPLGASTTTLPAVGTQELMGQVDDLTIEALVQSPSATEVPLQIICLFEYREGDIYTSPPALPTNANGLVHVDEALKGLLTDLRKSDKFRGNLLETLLIQAPNDSIKAKQLLLIGLGNRDDFRPEMMRLAGLTGMREALRLKVSHYAHASDLKDAGFDSPTAEVAGYVVQGAIEAYQTQKYLKGKEASESLTVTKMTLLAGQAYLADSKTGIQKVLKNSR